MTSRRTFTLEFKREAVRLVTERKLSIFWWRPDNSA